MGLCRINFQWKTQPARWKRVLIILVFLFVLSMAVNVYLGWKIIRTENESPLTMPKSFAFKYPDCANKLIEELNIDNVKIEPAVNAGDNNIG